MKKLIFIMTAILLSVTQLGRCDKSPSIDINPTPPAVSDIEYEQLSVPEFFVVTPAGFVRGPFGQLSAKPNEIIEGKYSLIGTNRGAGEYNKIMYTNSNELYFEPEKSYTVSCKYRILETLDKGFELVFYSAKGADANDWLNSEIIMGNTGDEGIATLTSTLKDYDDYQIFWNIIGKGKLAIDSISIVEKANDLVIADINFELPPYSFSGLRTDYRLDLTDNGTAVIHRESGETTIVPYGERMYFSEMIKYSKDTRYIIHNVRSQMETHGAWHELCSLPVDWLRADGSWDWGGKSAWSCIEERFNTPFHFPDQPDKVITGYVDFCEVFPVDWDPAYNPAWDKDKDMYIDDDVTVPDYIAKDTINTRFGIYMANYWTDSWLEQLKKKVDLIAAQNFTGVFFDVLPAHGTWSAVHPDMDVNLFKQREIELLAKISTYAREQYGTAFLITGNIGTNAGEYFYNLGEYLDGGYYQAFFFNWLGTGEVNEYAYTADGEKCLDFLRKQGLQVFTFENVGTGAHDPEVTKNFDENMSANYDYAITRENLMPIFFWAAKSDVTPYITTNFMFDSFVNGMFPRISRIIAGRPPFTDTPYDDWALGSEASDEFSTGSGDDMAYGGAGDDIIDGGDGDDAAYYAGVRNNYDVVRDGDRIIVNALEGNEGRDTLINIERLIFSDTTEAVP